MAVVDIKKLLAAGLWCRCGRRGTPVVAHQVLRCNLAQLCVNRVSQVQPGLVSAWGLLLLRRLAALWTTEHSRALLSCGGELGASLVATHWVSEHCVILSLCVNCGS